MTDNFKIFGFSGKIGVGKNYISEQILGKKLYDAGYNVHILAIADQLKYELGSRFSLMKNHNNFKEEMNETFNELFVNKSADTRMKLQVYGTEYCRHGGELNIVNKFSLYNEPCIWTKGLYLQIKNILSRSYDSTKDVFIITDVRFENEAEFIHLMGGRTIRIDSPTRNNLKMLEEAKKKYTDEKDIDNFINQIKNHESETNLDTYDFDYTINNEPNNVNLNKEIEDILKVLL
jgi:hypothetical protein